MALDAYGGWPGLLDRLCAGDHLSAVETEAILTEILGGEAEAAQIAGFLVGLKVKGETAEETEGLVRAMVAAAEPLEIPDGTIDIVGTGGVAGRREAALNVSTMACFVAVGAGATVCKHGNRKASSTSGSFDLLEALGIEVEMGPKELADQVVRHRIGFAFARTYHPAMRFAGPIRAGLGIPTVFNVLGPLSHPGQPRRQVIGAADPDLADRMVEVFRVRGSEHSWVVTGDQDLDELALTGPSRVLELFGGQVRELTVDPRNLGLKVVDAASLAGGGPSENAAIARAIFDGAETGPRRDIVALNAAAGLVVAGIAEDLDEGLEQAMASITDGSARAVLASISGK
ncbi:MAG TPA: anthranilate phosphoribosyltransferase [Acidimicrobiaceae bacterium]|nr:anthranilate phosphoribosyltransferase [Acidimicrobiaceae bacterium]HCV35258.1 anthranilate phosphoribosyltransferase [Acidimicrobiaceae bacterium]